jgi:hypothetical protein
MTPRVRVILGIVVIALAVVGAFFGPKEGESDNVTGDPATTPTVVVTNQVSTATINRSIIVDNVHITFSQATLASKFSDDRHGGVYTLRVLATAENTTNTPVGVRFDSIVRLILPHGQQLAPRYISLVPNVLPHQKQAGFFDFPLSESVSLHNLAITVNNGPPIPFA